MNSFSELVRKNRSVRKFHNQEKISFKTLSELVELSCYVASSKNRQPLRYLIFHTENKTRLISKYLKWAWYLKGWDGPSETEEAPAYIIMLIDKNINEKADFDAGIAAQTILLGAVEKQLAGCMVRTVNRYELGKQLELDDQFEIVMVIAIGKPAQAVHIEKAKHGNIEYWEDEQGHHVPKLTLDEILLNKPDEED